MYAIKRPAVMAPAHNSSELTASTRPRVDTSGAPAAPLAARGRNTSCLIHTAVTTPRPMHAILTMKVGFDSLAGAMISSGFNASFCRLLEEQGKCDGSDSDEGCRNPASRRWQAWQLFAKRQNGNQSQQQHGHSERAGQANLLWQN